jgi:hypothetical protein
MLPGQLYHVTHQCHGQSFLLKFAKDRNYEHDLMDKVQHRILQRESQWTEAFIKSVTDQLPDRRRWHIQETSMGRSTGSILREPSPAYTRFSAPKNTAKTL